MKPRGPEDGAWLAWNGAAIALGQLGNSLLLPALPRLAEDFHVPFPQSGLAITVYFTLFAVGSLVAGPLSDRYGRRLPLLAGLLLLALASVA
ncbi:MFS transporter, partial [Methylogaea oryzae]